MNAAATVPRPTFRAVPLRRLLVVGVVLVLALVSGRQLVATAEPTLEPSPRLGPAGAEVFASAAPRRPAGARVAAALPAARRATTRAPLAADLVPPVGVSPVGELVATISLTLAPADLGPLAARLGARAPPRPVVLDR